MAAAARATLGALGLSGGTMTGALGLRLAASNSFQVSAEQQFVMADMASFTANYSGLVIFNNISHGTVAAFLIGGGAVKLIGQVGTGFSDNNADTGKVVGFYYAPDALYGFQNRLGGTIFMSAFTLRTRASV